MSASSTFLSTSGTGYEAMIGRWSRRLAPKFIAFAEIGNAPRVLDVGCGTGNLTLALARNPAIIKINGIDFSTVYIEHAKAQSADPRVDLQVGDACALPFADATFDCALASLVIQFIPDGHRAVREMRRVTRPGGIVAATTWDVRGGFVAWRIIFDTAAMLDPNAADRRAKACARPLVQREGLARAWTEAGLMDVEVEPLTIRMDFASFNDFWLPNDGSDGPIADYLRTLGSELKSKVREAVRLAYVDGEPDGPRSYAATAWAVKGKVP